MYLTVRIHSQHIRTFRCAPDLAERNYCFSQAVCVFKAYTLKSFPVGLTYGVLCF